MNIEVGSSLENKEMGPTQILKYMEQMGKDLEQNAINAQAMIEEAKDRDIPIDLSHNEALKKFAPRGKYEIMLINLRSELASVTVDLLTQGVKMTQDELNARLKYMGKLK